MEYEGCENLSAVPPWWEVLAAAQRHVDSIWFHGEPLNREEIEQHYMEGDVEYPPTRPYEECAGLVFQYGFLDGAFACRHLATWMGPYGEYDSWYGAKAYLDGRNMGIAWRLEYENNQRRDCQGRLGCPGADEQRARATPD